MSALRDLAIREGRFPARDECEKPARKPVFASLWLKIYSTPDAWVVESTPLDGKTTITLPRKNDEFTAIGGDL